MNIKISKILISVIITTSLAFPVYGESLFRAGISQNAFPIQPRSLYSSVRARTIGDLVTIQISEDVSTSDVSKTTIDKSSTTSQTNLLTLINKLIPRSILPTIPQEAGNYTGSNAVGNSATVTREMKYTDTVTTQVVQILPNGNLVVQGKKAAVNAGENVDIVVSGIVDPRLLNNLGQISSTSVANFQIAVVGKGAVSGTQTEGTFDKVIQYLF